MDWRVGHGGQLVEVYRANDTTNVLAIEDGVTHLRDHVRITTNVDAIFACAGYAVLSRSAYLFTIIDADEILFRGLPLYRARRCRSLLCRGTPSPDDLIRVTGIESILNSGFIYFSPSFDLTRRLSEHPLSSTLPPLDRFLWNAHLRTAHLPPPCHPLITPLIYGHIAHAARIPTHTTHVDIFLISRRSRDRPGLRYTRRGIDRHGHVANFVETEQIVIGPSGSLSSFVQTRGSVPAYWHQRVDLSYKPRLRMLDVRDAASRDAAMRHFGDQVGRYGEVAVANLLSRGGFERDIRAACKESVEGVNNEKVSYYEFSVNEECGHVHYDRISRLIDQLRPFLTRSGTTLIGPDGATWSTQSGVVRTNCLDCLDRTNLTQLMIALEQIGMQVSHVIDSGIDSGMNDSSIGSGISVGQGIHTEGGEAASGDIPTNENASTSSSAHITSSNTSSTTSSNKSRDVSNELIMAVRGLWADTGDAIGLQYAGTFALKRSVTRGQGHVIKGLIDDGVSSFLRYYYNNFVDAARQDALDTWHGLDHVDTPLSPSVIGAFKQGLSGILSLLLVTMGPRGRIRGIMDALWCFLVTCVAFFLLKATWLNGADVARHPVKEDVDGYEGIARERTKRDAAEQ